MIESGFPSRPSVETDKNIRCGTEDSYPVEILNWCDFFGSRIHRLYLKWFDLLWAGAAKRRLRLFKLQKWWIIDGVE